MNFAAALAYLDEHMSYQKTGRIDSPTIDPITAICAALGDPQLSAPVIHVTGTNGKGSTVQMISKLLAATGLTVGTYTSPHLEHITERFKRNGEPITDDELAEQISAVAEVAPLVGQDPGYFEILTAAAFRWFADIAVDVAAAILRTHSVREGRPIRRPASACLDDEVIAGPSGTRCERRAEARRRRQATVASD